MLRLGRTIRKLQIPKPSLGSRVPYTWYCTESNKPKQRVVIFPVKDQEWMYYKLPEPDIGENRPSVESIFFSSFIGEKGTQRFIDSRWYRYYRYAKNGALGLWRRVEAAPPHSLLKTVLYPPASAIVFRSITPAETFFVDLIIPTTFSKNSVRSIQVRLIVIHICCYDVSLYLHLL